MLRGHLGIGGEPAGVGTAVNETVVYAFVALLFINLMVTGVQFGN
jgi:phospholipid/cholesterol/gamma-HCH transport system permease protein